MNTFDRNSLEEQILLVSRYVAGDLSRSERAEFEAWLVASPELAAEVEMERRLRRGIASAARHGWLQRGSAPQEAAPSRRWQYAAAASVLVSIGLIVHVAGPNGETASVLAGRVATADHPRLEASRNVRLGSVRGTAGEPDISISLADAPQELVIEPDVVLLTCVDGSFELECADGTLPQTPQYGEYEMDLVRRHGAALAWRSSRQQPAARNQLSFTLRDPGSLSTGDYDLVVRGHSPDHEEVVARFLLRVSAK